MSQSRKERLLLNVVRYMDEKLGQVGFTRYRSHNRNYCWLRKWNWKTDMVDLYDKSSCIIINYLVLLPPVSNAATMGIDSLFRYVGCGGSSLDYPTWPWSYKAFEQMICEAVVKGLPWFDQFRTPDGCMTYVREHALRPDVPQVGLCEAYFKTLPPEAHAGQPLQHCLLDPDDPKIEDYEYVRSMFDRDYNKPLPPMEEEEEP